MTGPGPRLGVVVLNWRGEAETGRCLEALAALQGVDLTVLVVDNGSGTGEAERLAARAAVLALPENRGFAGGMNAGAGALLAADVSHLLLLNNDCVLAPDAAARLLAAAADIAVPTLWHGRPPERLACWFAGGSLGPWTLEPHHHRRPPAPGAPPQPVTFATGCAWLVTREAWERLGGLEEGYFLYHEDVDACLRAQALGLTLAWVPGAEGWHVGGASTGSGQGPSPLVDHYDVRNALRLIRRRARGPRRWAALAWWALVRVPRKCLRILRCGGATRRASLAAVAAGVRDGLVGREGPARG